MKWTKWLSISLYNVAHKRKFFVQMVSGMTLVMSILALVLVFNEVISNFYNNLVYGRVYNNSVTFTAKINEDGTFSRESETLLNLLETMEHIEAVTILRDFDEMPNLEDIVLEVDGSEHSWEKDEDSTDMVFRWRLNASLSMGKNAVFTQHDYDYFEYNNPRQKLFLSGRDLGDYGEVLITDYVLERFGITDYSGIIGSNVSFFAEGEPIFENLSVAGIVNVDYYRMAITSVGSQVVISSPIEGFVHNDLNHAYVYAQIDSFENAQTVFNAIKEQGYGDAVLFDEFIALEYSYIVKIRAIINYILTFIGAFIAIAMFLNLYSIIAMHIKSNMKFYGITCAMGARKSELYIILSAELLIMAFCSGVISAGVSAVLIRLINYFASAMVSGDVSVSLSQYININIGAIIAVYLAISVMSNIVLYYNQRCNIAEMLRDGSR